MSDTNKRAVVVDIAIIIVCLGIVVPAVYLFPPTDRTITYDCSLVEISPDFPIQVKEACRKLQMERT